MDIEEMIREKSANVLHGMPMSKTMAKERAKTLRAVKALFQLEYIFSPGDMVVWKDGLKHAMGPQYGEPAVIMEVLDEPIITHSDSNEHSGSNQFRIPNDIIIGLIHDNSFETFHMDSRRFEHYND